MSAQVAKPVLNVSAAFPLSATRRALLLDRDGVINVNFGYVHTPESTQWVDGIFDLCRAAEAAGYALVVVTNQAGIARGFYSEEQFAQYTDWMLQQFSMRGINILRVYYCPHHPSAGEGVYRVDCECRKPRPGMILAAAQDMDIDLAESAMIGDKASDMQAGRAAGVGMCIQIEDPLEQPSSRMTDVLYAGSLRQAQEYVLGVG
ncbi:HAD family hydrolase [Stenotrophomonas sp. SY1]|uniref:D-glycero-alpha-D-manno-heptose-1,7-bisphosphate 7-phosphatase n=1 Tax=Stenotrophomonas sp. SY1 TaxID=477235 RepID=UPI001E4A030B|nr:HAD family hydrolase [Stenotrophomonas sp. SY1]